MQAFLGTNQQTVYKTDLQFAGLKWVHGYKADKRHIRIVRWTDRRSGRQERLTVIQSVRQSVTHSQKNVK